MSTNIPNIENLKENTFKKLQKEIKKLKTKQKSVSNRRQRQSVSNRRQRQSVSNRRQRQSVSNRRQRKKRKSLKKSNK